MEKNVNKNMLHGKIAVQYIEKAMLAPGEERLALLEKAEKRIAFIKADILSGKKGA